MRDEREFKERAFDNFKRGLSENNMVFPDRVKTLIRFYDNTIVAYLKSRITTIEELIANKNSEGYLPVEEVAKIQRMTGRVNELKRMLKRLEQGNSILDMILEEEKRHCQSIIRKEGCDLIIDF